ncbi:sensor histidine kinase [Methylomonas fluvii]|uniref:histidine kinase n=1 Tax=Methylomonas fluvii TaxID=1854564 RepID=A0ABR9DCL0_9GAMM|nr:sensor histidine kinase [Methylomonas fluvii]MBD9360521.1 sensor histidine kinase N-terminal domain-containing protein [Methylomonas fluvii]CAD6873345.1 Sensory histidine kinase QseC [Methylomonas fluvii]
MNKPQSLRAQLLSKLTLPLLFVVLLDAAASYFVAMHYTDLAYDRWLLDSVKSLTQEVHAQQNHVTFELPPIAVEVFRWDDVDKTFFKVESQAEGFMAGDADLPSPPITTLASNEPFFSNGEIEGHEVRIVSVLTTPTPSSEHVLVSVAETLNKRRSMMTEILLAVVLPQFLLLFITGFHVWTGVNRGLRPLNDLVAHLAERSARDFNPILDANVPLEVRSLTHTINDLLQRLGSTLITQQRFIENAAHQLRTPLAGLKLQAERARSADNPEAMKAALGHIKNAADRVAHLSTQLLVLARSESVSHSAPEFKPVDLVTLARESCMDWVTRALDRNIELGFDAPDAAVTVAGDEVLLRELLSNLLDNAICYGNSGGHINVGVLALPHAALIVEDDGPGISIIEQEKIFERFYRIQGSQGDGCGLGLAIVKEIADLHAARVTVVSGGQGRRGTRFEIVFSVDESVINI